MNAEYLIFAPLYMERVWGGRKMETLFGRKLPGTGPFGESWELVDRDDAQSVVAEGEFKGFTLHDLWHNHRNEFFGEIYSGPRFPILIKILDAAEPLSVQVHPPVQRTPIFKEEPKTEMWYFAATEEGSAIYVGLKNGVSKPEFESSLSEGTVADLLHRLPTAADEFIFIPSGRLHAIDSGNVIFEIQQNSDTTYRVFDWGRVGLDGLPRKLHLTESLRSIDFNDFEPQLGRTVGENLVKCDYFTVDRWTLTRPRVTNDLPNFSVFQVISGKVRFGSRTFNPGELFFVPARNHHAQIGPQSSKAQVLRTTLSATQV
jgi:mannose-6-phosphate isomerase